MPMQTGLRQPRAGIFGSAAPTMTPTAMPEPQKKKFDWGKLIGVLGDSLSIAGGGQAQFVPNMIDQRNRREAQDYAEQPYRWKSNNGSLLELGPDGQPKVVYEDPTPKINWVRADNGDGTFTMVPVGPNGPISGGGPSAAPVAPKGKLKPYGGQTATPSGTFRR